MTEIGTAILAALRTKSPQTPRELAKQFKLTLPGLRYQLKPLAASGAVVATGGPRNRQISLSGRRPAKEAP